VFALDDTQAVTVWRPSGVGKLMRSPVALPQEAQVFERKRLLLSSNRTARTYAQSPVPARRSSTSTARPPVARSTTRTTGAAAASRDTRATRSDASSGRRPGSTGCGCMCDEPRLGRGWAARCRETVPNTEYQ
jgi:hypothetical protein